MSSIFELDKIQDTSPQLDLDELYEKKQKQDQQQLDLYNKILGRIHTRIKTVARQYKDQHYCWYVIPETIIGVSRYNQPGCIAYVFDQLQKNGFSVRYIHPNTLYICWHNWIPSYIRSEIKQKTGIEIDAFGKRKELEKQDEDPEEESKNLNIGLSRLSGNNKKQGSSTDKKYKPIDKYKPTGTFIYDEELFYK
jgi:hypothetical protein